MNMSDIFFIMAGVCFILALDFFMLALFTLQ